MTLLSSGLTVLMELHGSPRGLTETAYAKRHTLHVNAVYAVGIKKALKEKLFRVLQGLNDDGLKRLYATCLVLKTIIY